MMDVPEIVIPQADPLTAAPCGVAETPVLDEMARKAERTAALTSIAYGNTYREDTPEEEEFNEWVEAMADRGFYPSAWEAWSYQKRLGDGWRRLWYQERYKPAFTYSGNGIWECSPLAVKVQLRQGEWKVWVDGVVTKHRRRAGAFAQVAERARLMQRPL